VPACCARLLLMCLPVVKHCNRTLYYHYSFHCNTILPYRRLCITGGLRLLPSGSPIKTCYVHIYRMHAACPPTSLFLMLSLTIFVEEYKLRSSSLSIISSHLLLPHLCPIILARALLSNILNLLSSVMMKDFRTKTK
jgi:hypothetical protein